jgi:hypothetical protein
VRFITVYSTTSAQDSGLFEYLSPIFQAGTGLSVDVAAVGTGEALALGRRGYADALIVHDRPVAFGCGEVCTLEFDSKVKPRGCGLITSRKAGALTPALHCSTIEQMNGRPRRPGLAGPIW